MVAHRAGHLVGLRGNRQKEGRVEDKADDQSSKTDTDTEDDMLKKIGQRPDRKPKKEQFERLPDETGGDSQAQAEM